MLPVYHLKTRFLFHGLMHWKDYEELVGYNQQGRCESLLQCMHKLHHPAGVGRKVYFDSAKVRVIRLSYSLLTSQIFFVNTSALKFSFLLAELGKGVEPEFLLVVLGAVPGMEG